MVEILGGGYIACADERSGLREMLDAGFEQVNNQMESMNRGHGCMVSIHTEVSPSPQFNGLRRVPITILVGLTGASEPTT